MRLDILPKLSLTFLLLVCAFTLDRTLNFLLFALLVIGGVVVVVSSRHQKSQRSLFPHFLFYIFSIVALITVLNGLFLRQGEIFQAPFGVAFYKGGLEFGMNTASRLAVLSTALFLFFMTTPIRDLITFLQSARFPSPLIVVLFLALHFLQQLPSRINQIFLAQEARGAPVRGNVLNRTKAFILILSPLLFSSLVDTLERGVSLDARGFRGHLMARPQRAITTFSFSLSLMSFVIALSLILWSFLR